MNTICVCLFPLSQFPLPVPFSSYHSAALDPSFTPPALPSTAFCCSPHDIQIHINASICPSCNWVPSFQEQTLETLTNGIPMSSLIQTLILQDQHFGISDHNRPTWFCCLHHTQFWGRKTAVSEFHTKSLPPAEVGELTVCLLHPASVPRVPWLLPLQALAKDASCIHNGDQAYSSFLRGDLSFAYSLETHGNQI